MSAKCRRRDLINLSVAQAYIADTSKSHERTKRMALIGAAFGLGFGLTKLSGGSNEDAIISGGVLAGLDLAMRAGGR